MYWLHLFDLSPTCVFKCVLKLPVWKDLKVYWLHFFDFSSLWVLRSWLEEVRSEQAKYKLHLFCSFYCIFSMKSMFHWLHLFDLILCVIYICVIKVPARVDAYSHWLHLFEFSPLWSFKWVYKTTAQEDGILRWLHMFCFYPLCIFKWFFKLPILEYA